MSSEELRTPLLLLASSASAVPSFQRPEGGSLRPHIAQVEDSFGYR